MDRIPSPWGGARLAASLLLALLASGCGTEAPSSPEVPVPVDVATPAMGADAADQQLQAAIPGLREPRAGLYTAGQPEPDAWDAAAQRVTTVINLRSDEEMAGRDEAAEVAAAGVAYHHLPIAGAADVTDANADQLRHLIEQAPGPVLVHCASGNRVGALLALGATNEGEMMPEQALAFGREAGLGRLESRVREVFKSRPEAE